MVRWECLLLGLLWLPAAWGQGPQPVAQFQTLEDSLSVAMAHRDQFGLDNLLLPGMVDISAAAQIRTRNQVIADALAGLPEPLVSIEQKVVNVRVVSDVAVVEGTYVLRLKEAEKTRDERGVFTHVWERVRNNWGCISAQRTAVVDEVEGKRRAASGSTGAASGSEKKSNAALPFHIPLIYKGSDSQQPPPAPAPANPPR